ncbi:MAG: methyltransferase domain-containing protein [Candidatus Portnoybacteria bacterium]|nr:methyltransferase domain-containing protein [Candidatus Portnoybacteria bacterium]
MEITREHNLEEIDFNERCYPDKTPSRVLRDHFYRYEFAAQFVKDKTILDIACGEGYGSEILRKAGAGAVYSVDNSSAIVAAANEKYPGINFITTEATKTSFQDQFFDIIISFETWHHLDDYENFIPEMSRILRPGGLLILSVPNEKMLYLSPFNKKFLTKYYRANFSKQKIEKYLKPYFEIKEWYGQRGVKKIYTNFFSKIFLSLLAGISARLKAKIDAAFKLGDGPQVRPIKSDNFRYLIVVAVKK